MSTINDNDQFLVQRGTNTYRQNAKDLMSTINADTEPYDYLLIQRGTDSYKVSAKDFKDQLGGSGGGGGGGDWTDDIKVRDGSNGAFYSDFGLRDSSGNLATPSAGQSWDQYCRTLTSWTANPPSRGVAKAISISANPCPNDIYVQFDIRNCLNKYLNVVFYNNFGWNGNSGINPKYIYINAWASDTSATSVATAWSFTAKATAPVHRAVWQLTKDSYDALLIKIVSGGSSSYHEHYNQSVCYWYLSDTNTFSVRERIEQGLIERQESQRPLDL